MGCQVLASFTRLLCRVLQKCWTVRCRGLRPFMLCFLRHRIRWWIISLSCVSSEIWPVVRERNVGGANCSSLRWRRPSCFHWRVEGCRCKSLYVVCPSGRSEHQMLVSTSGFQNWRPFDSANSLLVSPPRRKWMYTRQVSAGTSSTSSSSGLHLSSKLQASIRGVRDPESLRWESGVSAQPFRPSRPPALDVQACRNWHITSLPPMGYK
mmetsp:Transcript_8280/g.22970  ORF Transcript_8280/g.22970 Transcript_8280/m.22970 type:complete len:209 (+) Transcript_8280:758-1384(+)